MTNLLQENGRIGWFQAWAFKRSAIRLGAWGEWLALRHLRQLGWDILARNWTTRRGELDLIAFDQESLVFVEVKTRKVPSMLDPESNVTDEKRDQIERLSLDFLERFEFFGTPVRYDLIAIETPDCVEYELRHYYGFM